jgi:hypothetical protein
MRALTTILAALAIVPLAAVDATISNWTSGSGADAQTYVFRTRGATLTGVVCGPCDDPSTVFRIADGVRIDDTHATFSIIGVARAPAAVTLMHVDGPGVIAATVKYVAAPKTGRLDGRWVAAGRTAQQNVTLKLRDNDTVWGVICGPCDKPGGVFLLEDGTLAGDNISFFIHHTDRRNFMKGVISGNVMKFDWVREGHESEPGGQMTLIGPIR